jgi:hypothetical protein
MTLHPRSRSLQALLRGSCVVLVGIILVWSAASAGAAKAKPKARVTKKT